MRARLAGPGVAKGARHARECSAEIRPQALRVRGFLLQFIFAADLFRI